MRRYICCLLVLALFLTLLAGCVRNVNGSDGNGAVGGDQERSLMLQKKLNLASYFRFDSNSAGNIMGFKVTTVIEPGDYTDIVFVSDESQATGYPSDVIVAWPSASTERILWSVNYFGIWGSGYDPAPYGLTYPITMPDVLGNWEGFYDFVMSFDTSLKSYVLDASNGYAEDDESWIPLPSLDTSPSKSLPHLSQPQPSQPQPDAAAQ